MNTVEEGLFGSALFSFVTQHTGAFFLIVLALILIAVLTITWVVRRVKRETRQYVQNGREHLNSFNDAVNGRVTHFRSGLNRTFGRSNPPSNERPVVPPEVSSNERTDESAADLKEAPPKFKNVHQIR